MVWTLNHNKQHSKPKPDCDDATQRGEDKERVATSRRAEQSRRRLHDFQTAIRFRIGTFFKAWARTNRPGPPAMPPPTSRAPNKCSSRVKQGWDGGYSR